MVLLARQLKIRKYFRPTMIACDCQASKTAFRSHCARALIRDATYELHASEAPCPNVQPRAHARLTGLTKRVTAAQRLRWAGQAKALVLALTLVCLTFALTRALRARRARPPEVAEKGSISGLTHGTI